MIIRVGTAATRCVHKHTPGFVRSNKFLIHLMFLSTCNCAHHHSFAAKKYAFRRCQVQSLEILNSSFFRKKKYKVQRVFFYIFLLKCVQLFTDPGLNHMAWAHAFILCNLDPVLGLQVPKASSLQDKNTNSGQ